MNSTFSSRLTPLLRHLLFLLLLSCAACAVPKAPNPPLPGFNEKGSDKKAVAIADKVMEAMGGRAAWDQTRYLQWNFFGRRKLTWDKLTGRVRIESQRDQWTILLNINDGKGRALVKGVEITQPDSLAVWLGRGKRVWINDSYWLCMPFKLKDPGVTLLYKGEENSPDGNPSDKLQLTFEKVGATPDNKYHVLVDKKSRLITYWQYFEKYTDYKPAMSNSWTDYKTYGKIKLSGGRGERNLTEIAVFDTLPDRFFSEF